MWQQQKYHSETHFFFFWQCMIRFHRRIKTISWTLKLVYSLQWRAYFSNACSDCLPIKNSSKPYRTCLLFPWSHSFLADRYKFMAANLKQKHEEIWGNVSSKPVLISLKHFDSLEMVCFQVLIVEVWEIKCWISKVARHDVWLSRDQWSYPNQITSVQ